MILCATEMELAERAVGIHYTRILHKARLTSALKSINCHVGFAAVALPVP